MTATRNNDCSTAERCLYLAFELGQNNWQLALAAGGGQAARRREVPASAVALLEEEIRRAKTIGEAIWGQGPENVDELRTADADS